MTKFDLDWLPIYRMQGMGIYMRNLKFIAAFLAATGLTIALLVYERGKAAFPSNWIELVGETSPGAPIMVAPFEHKLIELISTTNPGMSPCSATIGELDRGKWKVLLHVDSNILSAVITGESLLCTPDSVDSHGMPELLLLNLNTLQKKMIPIPTTGYGRIIKPLDADHFVIFGENETIDFDLATLETSHRTSHPYVRLATDENQPGDLTFLTVDGGPTFSLHLNTYYPATDTWKTSPAWYSEPYVTTGDGYYSTLVRLSSGQYFCREQAVDDLGLAYYREAIYDPISQTWTECPKSENAGSAFLALPDGKLLAANGFPMRNRLVTLLTDSEVVTPSTSCQVFDPRTNTWTDLAPTQRASSSYLTSGLDGHPLLIGSNVDDEMLSSIHIKPTRMRVDDKSKTNRQHPL